MIENSQEEKMQEKEEPEEIFKKFRQCNKKNKKYTLDNLNKLYYKLKGIENNSKSISKLDFAELLGQNILQLDDEELTHLMFLRFKNATIHEVSWFNDDKTVISFKSKEEGENINRDHYFYSGKYGVHYTNNISDVNVEKAPLDRPKSQKVNVEKAPLERHKSQKNSQTYSTTCCNMNLDNLNNCLCDCFGFFKKR